MSKTASSIVKVAKSQVGNRGKKYNSWYGNPVTADWCGAFVTWVFAKAGASDIFCPKKGNPAYVPNIHTWALNYDRIVANEKKARAGDIVIFDWGADGTRDHVGIVQKNAGTCLKCIEGNTGSYDATKSKVAQKTRYFSDIYCIIRPKYQSATKKAANTKSEAKASTSKSKTVAWKKKYTVLPRVGMNVRKSYSTDARIVTSIPQGSVFTTAKRHGNWVYTEKYNGWVCIKGKKETYLKLL